MKKVFQRALRPLDLHEDLIDFDVLVVLLEEKQQIRSEQCVPSVSPVSFHFTPLRTLSFLPHVSQFPLTPGIGP